MSSRSPGVPGYETINVLANGSSTIVRARAIHDGSEVAIKLLDPASEPILPKRFDRQRRALQRLSESGRGFVPLLSHGIASDGRPYVVLPFLPLGSLQDQLDRGPTPWFPASHLMARVTEAVGSAHEAGAPLGDIRPSKILLQRAEIPLVSVFGMATRRFDDGRPSYRAPEADNDTPPTAPADVSSLALVLATLIAGRNRAPNEPISDFLAGLVDLVPERILDVLEHGLAASVTNRYGSAAAMHRALSRAIDEGPDQSIAAEIDSMPFDLDELFADPTPAADPDIAQQARATADGLPADLGDLVLVDEESDAPLESTSSDDTPDDHLWLPAGLDDIVLAPSPGTLRPSALAQDETNPFGDDDLTAASDDLHGGDALRIIDLTANGFSPPAGSEPDRSGAEDGEIGDFPSELGEDGQDADDDDIPVDDMPDEANLTDDSPGIDADVAETAGQPAELCAGDGDATREIVDLTELFTRTQEFVYDPKLHGALGASTEEGSRIGEGPSTARPPGEPAASPSATTTVLRQNGDVGQAGTEHRMAATAKVGTDSDEIHDLVVDESAGEATPTVTPAPPQMPSRPAEPLIDDDDTSIFPEADETNPPWLDAGASPSGNDAGLNVLDPDRSEDIPFPDMARQRDRADDNRWQATMRTRAELLWFQGRRTFSTLVAVLGLATIVAIVVIFAARELRSTTTSIDTDGVPQPLTTATTSANFVATDAPFITDVPPDYQPTTTAAPTTRRRSATTSTTVQPVTETTRSSTASTRPSSPSASTTDAPTTATTSRPTTERPTTERPTTERPTTEGPTTEGPTTTEEPPSTTRTTRRPRTTATTVATTVRTTTTIEVLPTDPPGGNGRNGNGNGLGQAAPAPPGLSQPALVKLSKTSATITYSSSKCVATRFRLAGGDGSIQTGTSTGYEASIHCSSAWNLDFSGSSRLRPGVDYVLNLTVKDLAGQTSSDRLEFTTPA